MISANSMEEVYEVLSLMDKLAVMKIPEEKLNIIINNRNKDYVTKIDKNDPFNENRISKEALDLLCYFDYHYWMSEDKKREVDKVHFKKIQEEEKRKSKVNNYNLFKNDEVITKDETLPTKIESDGVLQKVLEFLKKILKILKKE